MNVEFTLFGFDRHEWGTIHLYILFVLLALLVVHILMHWKMIKSLFGRFINSGGIRNISIYTIASLCLFLLVLPFIIAPVSEEHMTEKRLQVRAENVLTTESKKPEFIADETPVKTNNTKNTVQKKSEKSEYNNPQSTQHKEHRDHDRFIISGESIEVRGYMTLNQVSRDYDVPVKVILAGLHIPKSIPGMQKLGRLRREYYFSMGEIEEIIIDYKNNKIQNQ